jgi:hypothetical protein
MPPPRVIIAAQHSVQQFSWPKASSVKMALSRPTWLSSRWVLTLKMAKIIAGFTIAFICGRNHGKGSNHLFNFDT